MEAIATAPVKSSQKRKASKDRTQMVVRLSPELMEKVRYRALQHHLSINSYVEQVLKDAVVPQIPRLSKHFEVDPELRSICGFIHVTPPTQEELDKDPKCARIWEKYLKP